MARQRPLLPGMLLESVVLSLLLLLLAHLQGSLLAFVGAVPCNVAAGGGASPGRFVAYLGAGIYEELLFRLMLLPLVVVVLKAAGLTPRTSLAVAVVATSLLFAAAHYRFEFSLGTHMFATVLGEPFEWTSFLFSALPPGPSFPSSFSIAGSALPPERTRSTTFSFPCCEDRETLSSADREHASGALSSPVCQRDARAHKVALFASRRSL